MASDTVAGFGSSSINNSVATGIHVPDMSREKIISQIQHCELPTTGSSKHYISISMPPSPTLKNMEETTSVVFSDLGGEINFNKSTILSSEGSSNSEIQMPKQVKFYSQQLHSGTSHFEAGMKNIVTHNHPHDHQTCMRINELQEDKRFDSFKTWSGELERQVSNFVGKPHEPQLQEPSTVPNDPTPHQEIVPVYRYFDALEGPELETLRASEEELVLPKERLWPFLLRFPVSAFGICLGINSQAILWKSLATSSSTEFLHISPDVNYALLSVGLAVTAIVSIIYSLKAILYFEAVRREYYHPIRVNFFFAPWIAYLFIVLGLPRQITKTLPHSTWYVLTAPILVLDLKIYGQWMSGGARKLSKVANPSNHLAIVGNFVGAMLGASMGLTEGPLFFFAVGVAHYTVLFVTLYQRLPTNETLPKELHPVFFLFVAAPSVASMAWAGLQGSFDYGSRIVYFVALFLYVSLAVRVNFFRGFKFSLAWWAYTFPMTAAAIATIAYANEVQNPVTRAMLITLSAISSLTVSALFVFTALHAFVPRNLFPNDIAIAISHRRPKAGKRRSHKRYESSESSHAKDVEASMNNTRV